MRFFSFVMVLLVGVTAIAAEPKSIEELKAHFASVSGENGSYRAEFSIHPDESTVDSPEGGAVGGFITVRGAEMRMKLAHVLSADNSALNLIYDCVMDAESVMHMRLKTPTTVVPPSKMDTGALAALRKKTGLPIGIPAAALGSGDLAAGLLLNPSTILDVLEEFYDLKLIGKESFNGEDVFAVTSTMKPKTLKSYKSIADFEGMLDVEQKAYIGVKDGIVRKMVSGSTSIVFYKIQFDAEIGDTDFVLDIADGDEEEDITGGMLKSFEAIISGGEDE
ncbi:MAG: hypothetical protein VCD00_05150 [Candidatus Hydrogenedentota bacterium]